jgi:hypothetical protein
MAIVWAGPITQTLTADNLGDPEIVIPSMYCSKVTIQEADNLGTTEYIIRAPFKTSDPLRLGVGAKWEVRGKFIPGEPICYIETVLGTVQFTVVFE